jgi:hypothetical protein
MAWKKDPKYAFNNTISKVCILMQITSVKCRVLTAASMKMAFKDKALCITMTMEAVRTYETSVYSDYMMLCPRWLSS